MSAGVIKKYRKYRKISKNTKKYQKNTEKYYSWYILESLGAKLFKVCFRVIF
jgi:hypothetical protein